jgi:predicted P-loop ATPase
MLLPCDLQAYYTDSFDMGAQTGAEHKLATFGLINLDELDKFSPGKMALLKNLMQMAALTIRKAHKKHYSALPRIASFIATSNQKELLTDPTGSRRFLCVEVRQKIDCAPIDHQQLYAQLKAELADNEERHWFSTEEEAAIMQNNAPFQKWGMEMDVFHHCFRRPETGEESRMLSAACIYNALRKHSPAVMRGVNVNSFSKSLRTLGIEKSHTRQGNLYHVIPLEA